MESAPGSRRLDAALWSGVHGLIVAVIMLPPRLRGRWDDLMILGPAAVGAALSGSLFGHQMIDRTRTGLRAGARGLLVTLAAFVAFGFLYAAVDTFSNIRREGLPSVYPREAVVAFVAWASIHMLGALFWSAHVVLPYGILAGVLHFYASRHHLSFVTTALLVALLVIAATMFAFYGYRPRW